MLPILISDHAPMSCIITPVMNHPRARRWRFNDYLLSNADFLVQMRTRLSEFLENNSKSCDNSQTLWKTGTCFIRGTLDALRGEYGTLSINKAEFMLHRTKQKYYYDGDLPSRLLALQLK